MTELDRLKSIGSVRKRETKKDPVSVPVNAHTLYTPLTLQAALPCGERYYNSLVKAGLPVTKHGGRHWISGRQVLEFFERKLSLEGGAQ